MSHFVSTKSQEDKVLNVITNANNDINMGKNTLLPLGMVLEDNETKDTRIVSFIHPL